MIYKYKKAKFVDLWGFKFYIDEDVPKDTILIFDKNVLKIKDDTIRINKK